MANPEHVEIVKQGKEAIEAWREDHRGEVLDLSGANFMGWNLYEALLFQACMRKADLRGVHMVGAFASEADLSDSRLGGATLIGADLRKTILTRADLSDSNLNGANLSGAILHSANLRGAILLKTRLNGAVLTGALLDGALFHSTALGELDLSDASGLEGVIHSGPSRLALGTFARSRGSIPSEFLRGCGLADWEIELAKLYDPSLPDEQIAEIHHQAFMLRSSGRLQTRSLFISYSHIDSAFVDALEPKLVDKGIRFWRDKHQMTAGRIEKQIERAIATNEVTLLVLSRSSVESDWVEHEVRKARKKEKTGGTDVLCPVALDSDWQSWRWPERLKEQVLEYYVLDFSKWRDPDAFENQFKRLVDGLKLFYPRPHNETEVD